MKIKIISHNDTDGQSVNVINSVLNLDADIENVNNSNKDNKIQEYITSHQYMRYDITFIVDLPISDETAILIEKRCPECFIMLDHHQDSLNLTYSWAKNATIKNGVNQCGATLFYNYLIEKLKYHPNVTLERYLEGVRLYDTGDWLTASNKTTKEFLPEEINMIHSLYRRDFSKTIANNIKVGKVLSYENKQIALQMVEKNKSHAKKKNEELITIAVGEYKAGVVFIGQVSEIDRVHICLKNNHPELDFFMMVIMKNGISLRTTKSNVNLNEIAARYGGGGHISAAGMPYSDDVIINILKNRKI